MTSRTTWLSRVARSVVWVLVAAAVSFVVARTAVNDDATADVTAPLPPIALNQRATVTLTETSIAPVVSADGVVVPGEAGFLLEAPAAPDELAYRLLDPPVAVKARIKGGPSGFACAWAGLQPAGAPGAVAVSGARELGPQVAGVVMRCRIPDDIRVVAGMAGTMVLQMEAPVTAQALPVTAVIGGAERGQVIVVHDDGTTEVRDVKLGVSDVFNIQILSGLQPGEKVLQNPVQADFERSRSQR